MGPHLHPGGCVTQGELVEGSTAPRPPRLFNTPVYYYYIPRISCFPHLRTITRGSRYLLGKSIGARGAPFIMFRNKLWDTRRWRLRYRRLLSAHKSPFGHTHVGNGTHHPRRNTSCWAVEKQANNISSLPYSTFRDGTVCSLCLHLHRAVATTLTVTTIVTTVGKLLLSQTLEWMD